MWWQRGGVATVRIVVPIANDRSGAVGGRTFACRTHKGIVVLPINQLTGRGVLGRDRALACDNRLDSWF